MADFPETDLFDRVKNLNLPPESLIVVGSGAIEAVVGPEVRRAQDIDLVVTEEAFRHLQTQPGMQVERHPDGSLRLTGNGLDVGTGWRGQDVSSLQRRGYEVEGVPVAGLPDVVEQKQRRGSAKDQADLEIIKNRLYSKDTLPSAVIAAERRFVESCLPERLHGRPEVEVAANGLYIVRTVFGDREEIGAQTYSGEVEPGAVAIQHCWVHSAFGLKSGQRNIDEVNARYIAEGKEPLFSDDDRLIAVAGYGNHDAKVGDGREAVNPKHYDELQSAYHVVAQLEEAGVTDEEKLAKAHASVMATTYNEKTKSQDVDPARGYVYMQELSAGEDFAIFRTPFAVVDSYNLAAENLTRVGGGYDRPLSKLVDELNAQRPEGTPPIIIREPEDALELVRQYPDYPAIRTLGGKREETTLMEAFTNQLRGSANFFENYTPPGEWLDGSDDFRSENAARARAGAEAIERGEMTPLESYDAQVAFEASLNHPAVVGGLPGARPERPDTLKARSASEPAEPEAASKAATSAESAPSNDATTLEAIQANLQEVDRLLSSGSLQEALSSIDRSESLFAHVTQDAENPVVQEVITNLQLAKRAAIEAEQAKLAAREAARRYGERL